MRETDLLTAGFRFEITANCYSALRHLRGDMGVLRIWVDCICINQADEKEKASQIPLMDRIYAGSERLKPLLRNRADGFAGGRLALPSPRAAEAHGVEGDGRRGCVQGCWVPAATNGVPERDDYAVQKEYRISIGLAVGREHSPGGRNNCGVLIFYWMLAWVIM